jgi:hypothetical protein
VRQRQEDLEFYTSLGYIMKPSQKNKEYTKPGSVKSQFIIPETTVY